MASGIPVPCGPCKQGEVNTKADIWCYNCDEGLCSTCSSHHKRIKSSRDHKTIDIQTYTSYIPPTSLIKTKCDAHSLQFNVYCPSHLMPCCDECISTSHSQCTGITSLASVVEKTKIEKSKESVEKDINSITYFLDKLINNKSGNLKRGEQQYESIKQSVSKIRNEINAHLDHLEEQLFKETDTIWNLEKSKLTSLIHEIEDKQKILKEMKDDLKTVTENTSKLQCFLGLHQFEQQVSQYQRYIEDLEDSKRASEVEMKIKQNGELEKILKELQLIKSFGEVTVVNTEISLKRQTSVSREAQIELQEQSNIENMTMNIETTIQTNFIRPISEIICLMDGRVIVLEQGDKVNLLTSDGKFEKQLPIHGKAFSVSQIDQNTIAITYPFEKAIKIFNMKKETVTKVITLDKQCLGLSSSNNSLVVGLSKDEIRIIDLEGNTLKSIKVESKSFLNYLVYCNNRIVYSDFNKTVYCYDESGKQIWQHKHDLSGPRGLFVDTYGNIIVADFGFGSVKVISKDGQDSKVLVRKEDLGYKTWGICFNKHKESYGFICDDNGKSITRFNLSYD
ncbi:transcription intermediary factor 1-alpha-like [Mytilus edulis]|uniref:transcription intermediary factor 1-alpha-like n=1 Tax=Mytilus edulis TaxID=6550 RepID=UPI0039F08927